MNNTNERNHLLDFQPTSFTGTIVLSDDQITEYPFVTKHGEAGFYKLIRTLFETETHEIEQIDCCKLNVAQNIQDAWFAYGEQNNIDPTSLAMNICICGPKALKELPNNTVEIQNGCLTFKSKESEVETNDTETV